MVGRQLIVVYAIHNRVIDIRLRRLRKQDALCALRDVLLRRRAVRKRSGTLQHHVDPEIAPRQLLDVFMSEQRNIIAIDVQ